jgi:linoleoyl-CoA desaturase
MIRKIKFQNKDQAIFVRDLRKRVNRYFKENNISKTANVHMVIKTISMFFIYLVPYGFVYSGLITGVSGLLIAIVMGIGMSGIGMSVMHDANHGAYSSNPKVNKWVGICIYLIGGDVYNWKVQHNILHHTYTNIEGLDGDIEQDPFLRLSHRQKWHQGHQYQHIYGFFLYTLGTITWAFMDFIQFKRFTNLGLSPDGLLDKQQQFRKLIFYKIVYWLFIFVLPTIFSSFFWWQVLLGWVIMNMVAGFILTVTFQLAHVVEGVSFPAPTDQGNIENEWMIHQFKTTANFAKNSPLVNWFVGGLNFQIEHHLFPNICHVHYKQISTIVKATALEYGILYNENKTYMEAVISHYKMLKMFGLKPRTVS